jgi:hypothetical protein
MPIRYSSVVGASASSGFNLDIGTSGNTTFVFSGAQPAGNYSITSQLTDTSIEFYAVAEDNTLAGYTNNKALTATKDFNRLVVYGATNNDLITFEFKSTSSAASSGDIDGGAAPYITAISVVDLPNIDDTTIISGGNFATNVAVTFTGVDLVARSAKSIVRTDSTQLVVTRPDSAIQDYAPYTITVTNPGIPDSVIRTYTQSNILVGGDPVWSTSTTLPEFTKNVAYSQTVSATDPDSSSISYSFQSGTLPPGLSFDSATATISGTPIDGYDKVFTIRATDQGGNTTDRQFTLPNIPPSWTTTSIATPVKSLSYSFQLVATADTSIVSYAIVSGSLPTGLSLSSSGLITGTPTTSGQSSSFTISATDENGSSINQAFTATVSGVISGGTVTTSGGYTYHTFSGNGTLDAYANTSVQYLVIAGGGGRGAFGGGGAGGYLSGSTTINTGSYDVTIGGGGANYGNGGDSSIGSLLVATGGGGGAPGGADNSGRNGGSGGGASSSWTSGGNGGTAVSGQGNAGGSSGPIWGNDHGAGGGGAGAAGQSVGTSTIGGNGGNGLAWLDNVTRAGGGAGGVNSGTAGTHGNGSGVNTGGGGNALSGGVANIGADSGVVIIRYPS